MKTTTEEWINESDENRKAFEVEKMILEEENKMKTDKKLNVIYYTVENSDEVFSMHFSNIASFSSPFVECMARAFFDNHGGWNRRWPLVFRFFSDKECNFCLGMSEVEIENEPKFNAREMKTKTVGSILEHINK